MLDLNVICFVTERATVVIRMELAFIVNFLICMVTTAPWNVAVYVLITSATSWRGNVHRDALPTITVPIVG